MPQTVSLPDGRRVRFPDDATAEEIDAAVNELPATAAPVSAAPTVAPTPPPELTTLQRIVRGSAASMIGGALGAAGGTLVAPGPGTVVGAMAGSGAGEALTQFVDPFKSGVTEASVAQIVAATGLPMVPAAARRVFMSLPGAAAGLQEFLFRRLGNAGERVLSLFAPTPGTATRLFEAARQSGATLNIAVTETAQVTKEIAEEVGKSKFATSGSAALAKKAGEFVEPGAVPFNEFRLNQSDLGAVVRSLERKGGAALGRAKQLYGAMWDDLNAALGQAQGPTGETLRAAIDAFKREEAAAFFKEFFTASTLRRVGRQNLDVDALMTKIDRHRDVLKRLLPESEIGEILTTLAPLAKIPTMAKTPRLGFETMPFAERAVVSAGAGAILGGVTLGGAGAVGGAATGVLATEAISVALTTAPGRLFVRMMAERGATLDQVGNALLQSSRVALSPPSARPQVRIPQMLR